MDDTRGRSVGSSRLNILSTSKLGNSCKPRAFSSGFGEGEVPTSILLIRSHKSLLLSGQHSYCCAISLLSIRSSWASGFGFVPLTTCTSAAPRFLWTELIRGNRCRIRAERCQRFRKQPTSSSTNLSIAWSWFVTRSGRARDYLLVLKTIGHSL